jgi:hypothetical protein
MKTRFIMCSILFLVVFSGCKNDKPLETLPVVTPPVVETFNVTLDVLVKKDDNFSLFYTTDGSIDFTKIEPIWIDVKGSELNQKITYNLPENIIPTQLRLDFGLNKDQEDIILNSVTMEYKGKSRIIAIPELVDFFRADESKCTFDFKTGIIVSKIVKGEKSHPSLYPHEANLKPEIEKLIQ